MFFHIVQVANSKLPEVGTSGGKVKRCISPGSSKKKKKVQFSSENTEYELSCLL